MQLQIALFKFSLSLVLSLLVIIAWHNVTAFIGTVLFQSTFEYVNVFTEYSLFSLIKYIVLVAIGLNLGLNYLRSRR